MQVDNLIQLIKDQANNLDELIINLKMIQQYIVANDLENLQDQIEREEKILHHIKQKEEERTNEVKELIKQENLDCSIEDAMDKISEILNDVDAVLCDEFLLWRKELTENVGQVMYLNSQNSILINNSRKFIRDLIKNLLGSKKDNFFDRKFKLTHAY